ncbi:MAG: IS3 family transposase [Streptosporangiaceae bacterium]
MAAFIVSQGEGHGVPFAVSCRALGVSPSWFYKWRPGVLPASARRRERLDGEVTARFAARNGKDGAPRITAALREDGWRVSEKTVAASMARQGLLARPGRRGRRGSTRRGKGRWRAEDLVKRKFAAAGINRRWYSDGTEIVTGEGKLYLDSVLDMGSRRILGHALGEHHDAALSVAALLMAAAVRGGNVAGVVMHTDQGSEYTAEDFRAACGRLGIVQSMGRPGSALDNAVIESWHSTLEWELRSRQEFATRSEARAAIAAWIEDYNHVRRHSALGMKSPVSWERDAARKQEQP